MTARKVSFGMIPKKPPPGKPKAKQTVSALEQELAFLVRALKLPEFIPEYRFDAERKWRFDGAWPDRKIAVECEGGIWSGGRHTRGAGFEADCAKYNAAALAGWRVLRFTLSMFRDGSAANVLERAFA